MLKCKMQNRNAEKQPIKKSLTTFFVSREEGHLKARILIGGFAIFKATSVVLSIIKFNASDNFKYLQHSRYNNSVCILFSHVIFCQVKNLSICVLLQNFTFISEMLF